ncbi:hypothetical protein M3Y99_00898300 [Aphelenchoides fujianensis]|nr:hypothetical protein M3Y99_00898300 [Aphelenchoides fujianensis]
MSVLQACVLLLAVGTTMGCSPTAAPQPPPAGTTATTLVLDTNVPVANAAALVGKLQSALGSLDTSKYGTPQQGQTLDPAGNLVIGLTFQQKVNCEDLRADTQKVKEQVSEITRAVLSCDGQQTDV